MTTYNWQLEHGDASENVLGDVAGASGSVNLGAGDDVIESFTLDDTLVGGRVRWRVTNGITTEHTGWSDVIAPAGTTPPPPSAIKPDPPASYSDTGTVTISAPVGNGATIDSLFHPTWQHIVRTAAGVLFVVFLTRDNSSHNPTTWILRRSNNGGASWTTEWDSSAHGDPQMGMSPALELDENENLYLIANYYPSGGTKLYKFSAASNYAAPSAPITISSSSSGKWSVFLDQTRGWIWILYWSFNGLGNNLIACDYNGVVKYQRGMFKAFTALWAPTHDGATDKHGPSAHYPCIYVDAAGVVYVAWNNEAFEAGNFPGSSLSYYDVRMVYSESTTDQFLAKTETWLGPTNGVSGAVSARTLPLCADDSSASLAERAFPICKTSNRDEFIPASASDYGVNAGQQFNFNRLFNICPNQDGLLAYYESETSVAAAIKHHSIARWRKATGDIDDAERHTPDVTVGGAAGGQGGGAFVQDTTMESRAYFVQATSRNADGTFRVIRSDDGGVTLDLYATSPAITVGANGLLQVQAYRYVGSDGVIPVLLQLADSPYTVYVGLVTPD